MSSTQALVQALKLELKAAGVTYADLAVPLGLSESSIKRIFSRGDMPLSRVDEVLRVLKLDFADLARRIADAQPLRDELTLAQEAAVVADRRLMLMAICCLSQWSMEEVMDTYSLSEVECVAYFRVLDRLGLIELRPMNRYRLKMSKTFRWRPDGPVMAFFREHVAPDYFSGGFDGPGELMMLVHGQLSEASAVQYVERLQRLGQDFAQQHLSEQRLPQAKRFGYTMVVGVRSWLFEAFRDLRHDGGGELTDEPHG